MNFLRSSPVALRSREKLGRGDDARVWLRQVRDQAADFLEQQDSAIELKKNLKAAQKS
jgi:hypothetical protein